MGDDGERAGTLTFWWKVIVGDQLRLSAFCGGWVEQGAHIRGGGWVQASFPVAAGSHTLRWTYSKCDGNTSQLATGC